MGIEQVRVHLLNLPCSIHGFTVMIDWGSYDVYINSKIGSDEQIKAYDHEIRHIDDQDFDSMYRVEDIERLM